MEEANGCRPGPEREKEALDPSKVCSFDQFV